jgi:hypothetical protein
VSVGAKPLPRLHSLSYVEVIEPADGDGLEPPPFRFFETDMCPLIYRNAGSMVSLGRV